MHPAPQIQEYLRASATTTQKFIATTTTEKTWKQSPKSQTKKVKKYNLYMRYSSATANLWQTPLERMQNRRTYDCWYWQQRLWVLCFQYKYPATISHILHHLKKRKKKRNPKDNYPIANSLSTYISPRKYLMWIQETGPTASIHSYWEGLGAGARELRAACRDSVWLLAFRHGGTVPVLGTALSPFPCKATLSQSVVSKDFCHRNTSAGMQKWQLLKALCFCSSLLHGSRETNILRNLLLRNKYL